VTCFKHVIELCPTYSDVYSALAVSYMNLKKFDLAVSTFKSAFANGGNSQMPLSIKGLSRCYEGLGDGAAANQLTALLSDL